MASCRWNLGISIRKLRQCLLAAVCCWWAIDFSSAQQHDTSALRGSSGDALALAPKEDIPLNSFDLLEEASDELMDHIDLFVAVANDPQKVELLFNDYAAVLEDATGVSEIGSALRGIATEIGSGKLSLFALLMGQGLSSRITDEIEQAGQRLVESISKPRTDAELLASDKDPILVSLYRLAVTATMNDAQNAIADGSIPMIEMPELLEKAITDPVGIMEQFGGMVDLLLDGPVFLKTRLAFMDFVTYLLENPPASFTKMAEDVIAMEEEVDVEERAAVFESSDLLSLLDSFQQATESTNFMQSQPEIPTATVVADVTLQIASPVDLEEVATGVTALAQAGGNALDQRPLNDEQLTMKVQDAARLFAQLLNDFVQNPPKGLIGASYDVISLLNLDEIFVKMEDAKYDVNGVPSPAALFMEAFQTTYNSATAALNDPGKLAMVFSDYEQMLHSVLADERFVNFRDRVAGVADYVLDTRNNGEAPYDEMDLHVDDLPASVSGKSENKGGCRSRKDMDILEGKAFPRAANHDMTEGAHAANSFFEILFSCSRKGMGQAPVVFKCLQAGLSRQNLQLSNSCASCYADVAECGAKHCSWPCLLNSCGSRCLECGRQHCRSQLLECAKVERLPEACSKVGEVTAGDTETQYVYRLEM
eukprot:GHVT01078510.1.p1 GENE.GHVT01078510.1~~GHVT01078510.1.p1  ORF type:complete len:651 (+),score=58.14 GHVT01078510.1:424-2376(+)